MKFSDAYKRLNEEQKLAVDTIEGPIMVIAGPGTGKTQILSLRIANIILKTDTDPSAILAIAFTESAVKSMRQRLISIMGDRAYDVEIHTFHSLANKYINEYPDYFEEIIGGRPATEIEKREIVSKILENNSELSTLRPRGDVGYYIDKILNTISHLKRENYNPEKFYSYVNDQKKNLDSFGEKAHLKGPHKGKIKGEYLDLEKKIEKNLALATLYDEYEKFLLKEHIFDFEDMILAFVRALENKPDFKLILQERHQYLLVDEHQDTNSAQNRIIELLSDFHYNPNLFIVGDEKQAIYRFQGASLENFLYFKNKFPEAKVCKLSRNYRSNQVILDSSHSLILKNTYEDKNLIAPLVSMSSGDTPKQIINYVECDSEMDEINFISNKIKEIIKNGISPKEIAVIYRNNRDAELIEDNFSLNQIPYVTRSNKDVFSDDDVIRFIDILESVNNPTSDVFLSRVMFYAGSGFNFLEAAEILASARKNKISVIREIEKSSVAKDFLKKIKYLHGLAHNNTLREVLRETMNEFGFLAHILKKEKFHDKLNAERVIFNEAENLLVKNNTASLGDFLMHINKYRLHDISLKAPEHDSDLNAVELMTAHRSKGLEFKHVFIVGFYDGHWGNKSNRNFFYLPGIENTKGDIEDERRLFYVALTRAKESVYITYPKTKQDGTSNLPSVFISEIDESLINSSVFKVEKMDNNLNSDRLNIIEIDKKNRKKLRTLKFGEFIVSEFLRQGLNVTALNTFIECPKKYLFNNLLRLPRLKTNSEMYGTTMHSLMKYLFDNVNQGNIPKITDLYKFIKKEIDKLPVDNADLTDMQDSAKDSIDVYYKSYKDTWAGLKDRLFLEKKISFNYKVGENVIPLTGNLDKIEIIDGGVRVVDYKTGKPKSRNELLGKTKNSDQNYIRQLTFYRLLIEGSDLAKKYKFNEGVIDFLEPDNKGLLKREIFSAGLDINDDALKQLKLEIEKTAKEILTLSFLNHNCSENCRKNDRKGDLPIDLLFQSLHQQ